MEQFMSWACLCAIPRGSGHLAQGLIAVPAIEMARWNKPANICDLFRKTREEHERNNDMRKRKK
jgi:hypothetical protein